MAGGAKDVEDGTQLRVRGSMIQSGRDCLRDDDWQVLLLCSLAMSAGLCLMSEY